MCTRAWVVVVAAMGLAGWFGRAAFSGDEPKSEGAGGQDTSEQAKALAAPGEMHAWLAKYDGTWDVRGAFMDEKGARLPAEGTATFRMILGGRYSEQTFSTLVGGKPFDGHGIVGYDNLKKQFFNYWFDSWSTYTFPAFGQRSEDGTSVTLSGTWEFPGLQMPFKHVYTWVDDDHVTFRLLGTIQGQEMEIALLHYTRK